MPQVHRPHSRSRPEDVAGYLSNKGEHESARTIRDLVVLAKTLDAMRVARTPLPLLEETYNRLQWLLGGPQ